MNIPRAIPPHTHYHENKSMRSHSLDCYKQLSPSTISAISGFYGDPSDNQKKQTFYQKGSLAQANKKTHTHISNHSENSAERLEQSRTKLSASFTTKLKRLDKIKPKNLTSSILLLEQIQSKFSQPSSPSASHNTSFNQRGETLFIYQSPSPSKSTLKKQQLPLSDSHTSMSSTLNLSPQINQLASIFPSLNNTPINRRKFNCPEYQPVSEGRCRSNNQIMKLPLEPMSFVMVGGLAQEHELTYSPTSTTTDNFNSTLLKLFLNRSPQDAQRKEKSTSAKKPLHLKLSSLPTKGSLNPKFAQLDTQQLQMNMGCVDTGKIIQNYYKQKEDSLAKQKTCSDNLNRSTHFGKSEEEREGGYAMRSKIRETCTRLLSPEITSLSILHNQKLKQKVLTSEDKRKACNGNDFYDSNEANNYEQLLSYYDKKYEKPQREQLNFKKTESQSFLGLNEQEKSYQNEGNLNSNLSHRTDNEEMSMLTPGLSRWNGSENQSNKCDILPWVSLENTSERFYTQQGKMNIE